MRWPSSRRSFPARHACGGGSRRPTSSRIQPGSSSSPASWPAGWPRSARRPPVPLFSTALSRWMDGPELDAGVLVRQRAPAGPVRRRGRGAGRRRLRHVHRDLPAPDAGGGGRGHPRGHRQRQAAGDQRHAAPQSSGAAQLLRCWPGCRARGGGGLGRGAGRRAAGGPAHVRVPASAVLAQGRRRSARPAATAREPRPRRGSGPRWRAATCRTWPQALAVDGRHPFGEVLPALAAWRRAGAGPVGDRELAVPDHWAPVTEPDPVGAGRHLAGRDPGRAGQRSWRPAACGRWPPPGPRSSSLEAAAEPTTGRRSPAQIGHGAAAGRRRGHGVAGVAGVLSLLALDEAPVPGHPAVPAGLAARWRWSRPWATPGSTRRCGC